VPQTILVVDDEQSWRELLRQVLEAHGYRVEATSDGEEALAVALTSPPSLVLLDRLMPGMDGLELCSLLRRHERTQDVPILMLTVRQDTASKVGALEAGADDYLTKPCDFDELLARVRARLRRPPQRESAARGEALRLDPARRQAVVQGRAMPLTRREYDLLDLLLREATRLVPRETIAREVWAGTCDADANVIEVYIRRLRRKLADAGYAGRIRTMWGVGYVLEPADSPEAASQSS
jgi:DNA-binding response OmpR family regulator